MRANMLTVVADALGMNTAVPALTTYDFTTAQAVVAASEAAHRPVILLVPPKAASGMQGLRFVRALRGLADDASTPVCVQLDHATDLQLVRAAVDAGADAVLADGSALPHDQNAEFVRQARAVVGPGIVLEAELGDLPGDEDIAHASAASGMTDPDTVPDFLEQSAADLLAVAVGNVHGHYAGAPKLDWDRIAKIRVQAGDTPLVLHGASGIPQSSLEQAGAAGIGKINMNTELRSALFTTLAGSLDSRRAQGLNVLALLQDWTSTVEHFTASMHAVTTAHRDSVTG